MVVLSDTPTFPEEGTFEEGEEGAGSLDDLVSGGRGRRRAER